MEWVSILQAFLSLVFVIGLLLLTLWLIKYCQLKGINCRMVRRLKNAQRLDVLEMRRLDARNTLLLFRCDDQEYVVMLGAGSPLLIDHKSAAPKDDTHD